MKSKGMPKPKLFRVRSTRRSLGDLTREQENITRAISQKIAAAQIADQRGVISVDSVRPANIKIPEIRPSTLNVDSLTPDRFTSAQSLADPNTSYQFTYALVPLDKLITSHDDNLNPNPLFPKEMQPRLRDRAASKLQIGKIANSLSPDALLQDVHQLDRGPAIIGSDFVVESGNGRTMALRLARDEVPSKWQEYQIQLTEAIGDYGFSKKDLSGISDPVLVRMRITEVDRPAFASEANQSAVLTMSPLEQALQDANRLSLTAVNNLSIGESQSLEQALASRSNRSLVQSFLEQIPANERAALVTPDGGLNQLGIQRLKAALFSRTYPGDAGQRLTQAFFESLDPTIRTIELGMMGSLPAMSRSEELIKAGHRPANLSLSQDLSKTVDVLARLKEQKISVADYLNQSAMFERELTPPQEELLTQLSGFGRSSRKIRSFLEEYAESVIKAPPPQQGSFLQEETISKEQLLESAARRAESGSADDRQTTLV